MRHTYQIFDFDNEKYPVPFFTKDKFWIHNLEVFKNYPDHDSPQVFSKNILNLVPPLPLILFYNYKDLNENATIHQETIKGDEFMISLVQVIENTNLTKKKEKEVHN